MNPKLIAKHEDNGGMLRIDRIFPMIYADCPSDGLSETLLELYHDKRLREVFGKSMDWLYPGKGDDDEDMPDSEIVKEMLSNISLRYPGYLLAHVSTPIMEYKGTGKLAGASFSWGYTTLDVLFAKDMDGLMTKGLKWVEARDKEFRLRANRKSKLTKKPKKAKKS